MLICIYKLTDDETFNLWDISNLILVTFLQNNSDLLIISDRLCFIGFNILFISAIGISAKSHIGATLHESHTLALSTRTNDGAIDGQVCFHRRSFDDPVKPRRSTTGSMGPLMGTNKAAWGVKLLLTTVSAYQVDCGCFCAILNTQHCCLSPCGWYYPPSASHPQRPPHPLPPSTPYKLHP